MNLVAIIPARGSSKGIKNKNIKNFYGKPLISYIIETATHVDKINRIIVSSESKEIIEISKDYGAETPFIRPKELANDGVPTLPVLKHAINYLEEKEGYNPDAVVLLYATSPLLKSETLSNAIEMFQKGGFDSLISVIKETGHYWIKKTQEYKKFHPKDRVNRQLIQPLLKENGAIYITKKRLISDENQIVGGKIGFFEMDKEESIDIDTLLDFQMAEFIYEKRKEG